MRREISHRGDIGFLWELPVLLPEEAPQEDARSQDTKALPDLFNVLDP